MFCTESLGETVQPIQIATRVKYISRQLPLEEKCVKDNIQNQRKYQQPISNKITER